MLNCGEIGKAIDMAVKGMICYSNHKRFPKEYKGYHVGDSRPEVENEDPDIMKYALSRLQDYYKAW